MTYAKEPNLAEIISVLSEINQVSNVWSADENVCFSGAAFSAAAAASSCIRHRQVFVEYHAGEQNTKTRVEPASTSEHYKSLGEQNLEYLKIFTFIDFVCFISTKKQQFSRISTKD